MQAVGILLITVVAAITYGIIHDQITARICLEYFTVGHPRLIESESPTVLGLFWGVVATWWVGVPLGVGLALAARAGHRPKLRARNLVRPILNLMGIMYMVAFLAGILGFAFAEAGVFELSEPLYSAVPRERHVAFLIDGWAHTGSYAAGIVGGIGLWIKTWRRRRRLPEDKLPLGGSTPAES